MADGDPMILQTLSEIESDQGQEDSKGRRSLLLDGPMEQWTDTAAMADAWNWYKPSPQPTPSFTRQAGARTSGVGDYFQRVDTVSSLTGDLGQCYQNVLLKGQPALPGRGHDGMTFQGSAWIKRTGAAKTKRLGIFVYDKDGSYLNEGTWSSTTTISTSWEQVTVSHTLVHDEAAMLRLNLEITGSATGNITIDIDELALWTEYTFGTNPAVPDDQMLDVPHRVFGRTINASLYRARPDATAAKHQKQLNFGLISLAQFKALRSLWLLDTPCRWQPFHPHLPSVLDVRLTDKQFNFRAQNPALGTNAFRGSLTLTEV